MACAVAAGSAWGLLDLAWRPSPPATERVPVLMYHHVGDWGPPGEWAPWVVKPADFDAQLDWLVAHGWHTVTMEEVLASRSGGRALPRRPVVLTFDDGWSEHARIAHERLEPRGMRGVFFVYTGALGAPGYLGWDDARAFESTGHEVLSHTVSHPDLVQLPPDRLARELAESRVRLERELGHPVRVIAYPFGSNDARVRAAAAEAGYGFGCLATGGSLRPQDPPFELPRWKMDYGEPLDRFVQRLKDS